MTATNSHRFLTIDATRGVAAIAVMFFHFNSLFGEQWLFPNANIAVDYFFCLSGFVLANAYDNKLKTGKITANAFMRLRLIRLYPMYILGTTIGLIVVLTVPDQPSHSIFTLAAATVSALAFIPYLSHFALLFGTVMHTTVAFPLNGPAWSLFFELVVNWIYAHQLPGKIATAIIIPTAFLCTCLATYTFQKIPVGWGLENLVGGFPRAIFSFFVGAAIFHIWRRYPNSKFTLGPIVPCLLVAAMAQVSYSLSLYFILIATAVPMTVWLATSDPKSEILQTVFRILGEISYPLYAIHSPIMMIAQWYFGPGPFSIATLAGLGGGTIAASFILARTYDLWARRTLSLASSISPALPRPQELPIPQQGHPKTQLS